MKKKIKKVFENAVWWSGVVMVGLVLGLTIQFVKAWTEPTVAPPNGNVGAPINTSSITQIKNGILSLVGLSTSYINVPGVVPAPGNVLTAQNTLGQVAWAAAGGGGGCYTCYTGGANWSCCHPTFKNPEFALGWWYTCAYTNGAESWGTTTHPNMGCQWSHPALANWEPSGVAWTCCK